MYAWIFRHLPGPLWLRTLLSIGLILLAIYLLMEYAFPLLEEYSPLKREVRVQ